jgi:hypothetical protein
MNGWKPVIFLEEAKISYDLTPIDFSKREQKALTIPKPMPGFFDQGDIEMAERENAAKF